MREKFEAIFDTGTTMTVGDPIGIEVFYAPLLRFGAQLAPEYGEGFYTSTWASNTVDQPPHDVLIFLSVPCNFATPISVYFGGKEFKISPATFNLGPVSNGSDTCLAGAASNEAAARDGMVGF